MTLGIDIASVDGNKPIDWVKAKRAGVEFAIFRATYKIWADPTWSSECERARAEGITVGAYLFPVMDLTAPSCQDQCAVFRTAISGEARPGDLPPTLDVEFPGGITRTQRTRSDLLRWIAEAIETLRSPMIYTSARVWDGTDTDSLAAPGTGWPDCPLWLSRYPFKVRIPPQDGRHLALPPVPAAWGSGNIWIHQYQGDCVGFPGFSATVDLNKFIPCSFGDRGCKVQWVQRRLGITDDGAYGPATQAQVRAFQTVHNLPASGNVDVATFAYLGHVKL